MLPSVSVDALAEASVEFLQLEDLVALRPFDRSLQQLLKKPEKKPMMLGDEGEWFGPAVIHRPSVCVCRPPEEDFPAPGSAEPCPRRSPAAASRRSF